MLLFKDRSRKSAAEELIGHNFAMKKAQFENFNDIFSYLADSLVDTDDLDVETVVDSLYGYGSLHGESLQTKVEQSPFYTKQYKKVTVKQQKQLRAVNSVQDYGSDYSDDEEEDVAPVKYTGKKVKGKSVGGSAVQGAKSSPQVTSASGYGKMFLGVSVIGGTKNGSAAPSPKYKPGQVLSNASAIVDTTAHSSGGNFEATIFIGQRKVSLGTYASVELAAQAHDRALIRANGPHNCVQSGVLNFSIHAYARDSLSKFSAFDTILRKQLFGSEWSGPKPCDFGFLMTRVSDGSLKRTAPFNAMDGSARKKRFKGQYSEGDASNSDDEYSGSGSALSKGKKLQYGNYYVVEPVRGAKRSASPEENEEPYFKSTMNKGQPKFKKEMFKKPVAVVAAVEDAAIPMPGDTIVVMHGQKERSQGRSPYERGIVLDKLPFSGWMVVGFSDQSSKHLRGELVTMMGSCETHMKYMKAPPEAVTDEDRALLAFFERNDLVKRNFRPTANSVASAAALNRIHHPTPLQPPPPVVPTEVGYIAAPIVQKRRDSGAVAHKLASAWYVHHKIDLMRGLSPQEYEPESLYTMANYPFLNATRLVEGTAHPPSTISNSSNGTSSVDGSQSDVGWGKRGVRAGSSAGVSNRPANFQAFNSNMFSPKMTDISASTSYILSQELTLFARLSKKTKALVDSSGAGFFPLGEEAKGQTEDDTALVDPSGATGLTSSVSAAGSSTSLSSTANTAMAPAAVLLPPLPSAPVPVLQPAPELCWQRSILYPIQPETIDLLATTRVQIAELLCSRSGADLLAVAQRAASVGVGSFEGVSEVLFDTQSCNSSSAGSAGDGNDDASAGCVRKYTFELPADNRKLILDLGVSAALVNASVIISSATHSNGEPSAGVIIVGYFSTAFEAALVREQILGLTRSTFGLLTSYGGTAGEKNMVSSKPNFLPAEWNELRKMGKIVARFTKKSCMP